MYSGFAQQNNVKPDSLKLEIPPLHSLANLKNNSFDKFLITASSDASEYNFELNKKSNSDNFEKVLPDGTIWRENADINSTRLMIIFGGMTAVDLAAYFRLRQVWYTEPTTFFHTLEYNDDMKKYQQMDKLGHFSDAYFTSDLTSKLYRWAGLSGNSSIWYGAMTGWLWMLQIELSDGFMKGWGWSWGDMLFNTLGSGFFVLQQYNYDLLGGLQPKFTYHYSNAWRNKEYYRDPGGFIEDYEGMTFWLTINIHHYLPDSWKKSYPDWLAPLGIAIGQAAKGIAKDPWGGHKEIFVGLDVDFRKIPVGDDSGFFRFLKSELNFIRLPLPTIRLYPNGVVWYGLYF
jgi:Predicted periplasmic lipoprotein (DUF2279)